MFLLRNKLFCIFNISTCSEILSCEQNFFYLLCFFVHKKDFTNFLSGIKGGFAFPDFQIKTIHCQTSVFSLIKLWRGPPMKQRRQKWL